MEVPRVLLSVLSVENPTAIFSLLAPLKVITVPDTVPAVTQPLIILQTQTTRFSDIHVKKCVWVEFLKAVSAAVIHRYETREVQNAAVQVVTVLVLDLSLFYQEYSVCACVCERRDVSKALPTCCWR